MWMLRIENPLHLCHTHCLCVVTGTVAGCALPLCIVFPLCSYPRLVDFGFELNPLTFVWSASCSSPISWPCFSLRDRKQLFRWLLAAPHSLRCHIFGVL